MTVQRRRQVLNESLSCECFCVCIVAVAFIVLLVAVNIVLVIVRTADEALCTRDTLSKLR